MNFITVSNKIWLSLRLGRSYFQTQKYILKYEFVRDTFLETLRNTNSFYIVRGTSKTVYVYGYTMNIFKGIKFPLNWRIVYRICGPGFEKFIWILLISTYVYLLKFEIVHCSFKYYILATIEIVRRHCEEYRRVFVTLFKQLKQIWIR